jgi:hypothetical protein
VIVSHHAERDEYVLITLRVMICMQGHRTTSLTVEL